MVAGKNVAPRSHPGNVQGAGAQRLGQANPTLRHEATGQHLQLTGQPAVERLNLLASFSRRGEIGTDAAAENLRRSRDLGAAAAHTKGENCETQRPSETYQTTSKRIVHPRPSRDLS